MSLEQEILGDLAELLTEHGVQAQWQGVSLIVLASRIAAASASATTAASSTR